MQNRSNGRKYYTWISRKKNGAEVLNYSMSMESSLLKNVRREKRSNRGF